MDLKQKIGLGVAALGFLFPFFFQFQGLSPAGHIALSIFLTAAVLWLFESIPIYATSMGVIFLEALLLSSQSPLLKNAEPVSFQEITISSISDIPESVRSNGAIWIQNESKTSVSPVALKKIEMGKSYKVVSNPSSMKTNFSAPSFSAYYGNLASSIIILFLGGFVLAGVAVKFNLDQILTGKLLKPFGTKPLFILIGLMLVTGLLSAFMSNTATTAMMITVVIPIVARLENGDPFKTALVLSIPIAANIGGMLTPIGTPPNAVVIAALAKSNISVSFGQWMYWSFPVVLIMITAAIILLMAFFSPKTKEIVLTMNAQFKSDKKSIFVYAVSFLTVILWISENIHGIHSSLVAMIPIVAFSATGILGKTDIRGLSWEVLWLVGGGIALGVALEVTGLANWMVSQVDWSSLGNLLMISVFVLLAVGVSNFLSNTVTATLLIPLALSLTMSVPAIPGYDVLIIALVIGLGASMAMVLPISTPPNAIAISTGIIETKDMMKVGLIIGILGIGVLIFLANFLWPFIVR